MHSCQYPYRRLYEGLLEAADQRERLKLISGWLAVEASERSWFKDLKESTLQAPVLSHPDSWRLYALSRSVQLLTAEGRQPFRSNDSEASPVELLLTCLGFLPLEESAPFHPVLDELVQCRSHSGPERVIKDIVWWRGWRLGNLIFQRNGVQVRAKPEVFDSEVVSGSTLYWAFKRRRGEFRDLSSGWGGNSQWRTSFRTDYLVGDFVFYNQLERSSFADLFEDGQSEERAKELIRHRRLVRPPVVEELFPYDAGFSENVGAWLQADPSQPRQA